MYQASVPVFLRGLDVLDTLLEKAAACEVEKGMEPGALIGARLAPDMLPLCGQIQRASDASKLATARLAGIVAPPFEDVETTYAQLHERIGKTRDFLQSVDRAAIDGAEQRDVVVKAGPHELKFRGDEYLLTFAIPNFFFHVTTAYDVLRHAGVPIGKLDYLGPLGAA
jgi:hypothetical protein